jgi:hypothetical protein
MDTSRKAGHLEHRMVSLDPVRLTGISRLMRNKIEMARIRHAELLGQLHGLESEHRNADNPHLQHFFMQIMETLRPQIKHAFDTISPYTLR